MKIFHATIACMTLLTACNFNSAEGSNDIPPISEDNRILDNAITTEEVAGGISATDAEVVDRKLIWTADMRFQVANVDEATTEILALAKKHGGFISDMQMTSNPYQVTNTISLRVANEHFHELVQAVKGKSLFLDRANINSNDVTEEYVDIESRLKTKREVRDRYIEILKNKAGSVSDLLEAEDKIRVITEEIEAKEGRLRYLQNKIDYSTITMEVYQSVDFVAEPTLYDKPYSEEIGESFSMGWSAIKVLILSLVTVWPLLLLLVGFLVWKRKWLSKLITRK